MHVMRYRGKQCFVVAASLDFTNGCTWGNVQRRRKYVTWCGPDETCTCTNLFYIYWRIKTQKTWKWKLFLERTLYLKNPKHLVSSRNSVCFSQMITKKTSLFVRANTEAVRDCIALRLIQVYTRYLQAVIIRNKNEKSYTKQYSDIICSELVKASQVESVAANFKTTKRLIIKILIGLCHGEKLYGWHCFCSY